MSTYLYRCTEQQLEEHLQRIAEAGDTAEHVVFKGGRDYVIVCRPGQPAPATIAPSPEWVKAITDGVAAALEAYNTGAGDAVSAAFDGAIERGDVQWGQR